MAYTGKNLPTVTSALVEMVLRLSFVLSYFLYNKLIAHVQHKRIYALKHDLLIKLKHKMTTVCKVIYLFIIVCWQEMTNNSCQVE